MSGFTMATVHHYAKEHDTVAYYETMMILPIHSLLGSMSVYLYVFIASLMFSYIRLLG
eukprot:COSAG02_NODE_39953_length_410_cov_85.006431_1_plen_58_part_00